MGGITYSLKKVLISKEEIDNLSKIFAHENETSKSDAHTASRMPRSSSDDESKQIQELQSKCMYYLVNDVNPHVIGAAIPWALPENIAAKPGYFTIIGRDLIKGLLNIEGENSSNKSDIFLNIIKQLLNDVLRDGLPIPWLSMDYQHVTSISPGQTNRLLIFDYVKLNDGGYLIMPYSEYGAPGPFELLIRPYRACLRLNGDTELVLEITVHGEESRSPLRFSLCVTAEKLDQLEEAARNDIHEMFQALNNLKCT